MQFTNENIKESLQDALNEKYREQEEKEFLSHLGKF